MDTIKQLFGVMMLGVAAWMLTRVTPPGAALLLWAVPAAVAAWLLWRGARGIRHLPILVRAAAVAAAAYALVLVVGCGDWAARIRWRRFQLWPASTSELTFRTIKSSGDLDREVAKAQAGGHAVMLDFYADWCVSCKEMEKYTFTDPAVQATLRNVVLLRANVTANDTDDQALLKRFGIFGPPTIAFYGLDGQERAPYRVVGFMKAPEFAALSAKAVGSATMTPTRSRSPGAGAGGRGRPGRLPDVSRGVPQPPAAGAPLQRPGCERAARLRARLGARARPTSHSAGDAADAPDGRGVAGQQRHVAPSGRVPRPAAGTELLGHLV